MESKWDYLKVEKSKNHQIVLVFNIYKKCHNE